MKRATGLKIILGALTVFVLILLAFGFVLQNMEMSHDKIEEKINAIVSKNLPVQIAIGDIAGNPLTGYYAGGVAIKDAKGIIISADRLHVFPSIPSLLQGELRLSELRITDISIDYPRVLKLSDSAKGSKTSGDFPVNRIRVINLRAITPYGELLLNKALLTNKGGNYTLDADGLLDKHALQINGGFQKNELNQDIYGDVQWDKAQINVMGQTSPTLSLTCDFKSFELSTLPRFIAATKAANLHGLISGNLLVSKTDSNWSVSGDITTSQGHAWKLPLSKLTTGLKYANRHLFLKGVRGEVLGSSISGDITLRFPASKDLELDITAQGRDIDVAAWHGILPWASAVSGKIDDISLDVMGPVKEWLGDISIYSSKLVYNKQYSLRDTSGEAVLNGSKPIDILFLGKFHEGSYATKGTISPTGDEFSLPLSLDKLSLRSLAEELPLLKEQQLAGDLTTDIMITKQPSGMTVMGTAKIPLLSLDKHGERLSSVHVDFATNLKDLKIERATTSWRGALISASGSIRDVAEDKKSQLDLAGHIQHLSLSDFKDRVPVIVEEKLTSVIDGAWSLSGTPQQPQLRFALSSPLIEGKSRDLAISDLRILGHATPSLLTLTQSDFSFEDSPFVFSGSLQWPQGNNAATWKISGGFSKFPLTVLAQKGLISSDISGVLDGELAFDKTTSSSEPTYSLRLKKSTITAKGVQFRDISGSVRKGGNRLFFDDVQGAVTGGTLQLSGSTSMPSDKSGQLDLNLKTVSLDIGRTLRIFSPQVRSIQGRVNSSIKVTGSSNNPLINAQANLHRFYAYGFYLPRVDIALSGTPKEIKFNQIKAAVGSGLLTATANARNAEGKWTTTMQAEGKKLNIRILSAYLPDEARGHLKGVLDFSFNANGTSDNFHGKGLITSPFLSFYNITSRNINAPFYIQDQYLTIEEALADFYGGQMKLQLAADLKSTKWGGGLAIRSADLTGLIRDVAPLSEGSITGKTDFFLRIAGDTRRTSLLDGGGKLSITDGEVSGFPGVDTVSKAMNNRPLLFKSLVSTFTIDGKNLYILPGSRVTAPADHDAYRYLLADGSANLESGIDLTFIGNINIRALNIFLSAVQGVLSSTLSVAGDTKAIVSDLLGGIVKGYSSREFRDVHFVTRGKPGQFYFGDFKIAPNAKQTFRPEDLDDPIHTKRIKEQKFMLNIEFPVGSAPSRRKRESLKDQVAGQVLLQALQGILNETNFGD